MSTRNLLVFPQNFANGRIEGVDPRGHRVSVDIQISDAIRNKHAANRFAVIPDVETISRGNPRRAGCKAGSNNSLQSRNGGVLLIHDAHLQRKFGDVRHFTGNWASVIAHDNSEPNPVLGVGYVEALPMVSHDRKEEMNEAITTRRQIQQAYSQITQAMLSQNEAKELKLRTQVAQLEEQLSNLSRYFFATTMVQCSDMRKAAINKKDALRPYLIDLIEQNSEKGALGGVLIRCVNDRGEVLMPHCVQNRARYNPYSAASNINDDPDAPPSAEVTPASDVVDRLMNSSQMRGLVNLNWSKHELLITPLRTYTYAYKAAEEHNQPRKLKDILTKYTDRNDGSFLAYPLAMRSIPGSSNPDLAILKAGATYTLGDSLGNPLLLGRNYRNTMSFSREAPESVKNSFQHLKDGMQYTIMTEDGNTGIATAKRGQDAKIRLYVNDKPVSVTRVMAEAPKSYSPSL